MLFLFQWAVGPVEVQVSSPNRPLLSCALRINLVFKNLQSFSIYPKSGVLGVVYSVVQFSTSMCTVCNQIHTLTSRGWAQEFIHSSKRSLSQTPPSSQPPWCFQFPPCSSDQSSHSATHSCNCTHILRQAGEHRKRKSKGILPHPLETTASLVGEEVSFPWAVGCCGLCLHAQLRVTGCTESRLQEYRVWQRDSLPVGGTWDSDLSPPNLPTAIYFSESSNSRSRHSVQVLQHLQWKRWNGLCLRHLTWNQRSHSLFYFLMLLYDNGM